MEAELRARDDARLRHRAISLDTLCCEAHARRVHACDFFVARHPHDLSRCWPDQCEPGQATRRGQVMRICAIAAKGSRLPPRPICLVWNLETPRNWF